jgi:hypothetical protein
MKIQDGLFCSAPDPSLKSCLPYAKFELCGTGPARARDAMANWETIFHRPSDRRLMLHAETSRTLTEQCFSGAMPFNSLCLKSKNIWPENVLPLRSGYGDGHAEEERAAGIAVVRQ